MFGSINLSSSRIGGGGRDYNKAPLTCKRCGKKIFKDNLEGQGCNFCRTEKDFQAFMCEPEKEDNWYEERNAQKEIIEFCHRQGKKAEFRGENLIVNGNILGQVDCLTASVKIEIMEV